MALTKKQLEKIWKQLDGACEAIERLSENGIEVFDDFSIDFSAIVILKNEVEVMIEKRIRNGGVAG